MTEWIISSSVLILTIEDHEWNQNGSMMSVTPDDLCRCGDEVYYLESAAMKGYLSF